MSGSAHADAPRYAVVVGNNDGAPSQGKLEYAESDALKMFEVLQGIGDFAAANTLLLRGANASAVNEAVLTVNERIRGLDPAERERSMLVVYYSGHGDASALHLGDSTFPLRRLEKLVSGSAAAVRVLILDSCRSGAATRVKGGRLVPSVQVQLRSRLSSEGLIILTASAAGEDAQESDELQGSFFTHYLVSGLLGAADRDGDNHVGLQEAYDYAYQHTLRASSRTLQGVQHPTFRFDTRGTKDIAFTRVARPTQRAQIELPKGYSYLLLRSGHRGAVVAEVDATDPVRTLSLSPGRYFVRVRARDYLLEGQVELRAGVATRVNHEEFRRTDYARLVRKGGSDLSLVHGPRLAFSYRSALLGEGEATGLSLSYVFESRYATVAPRLSFREEDITTQVTSSALGEMSADVFLGHSLDVPWRTTLEVGAVIGGALLSQKYDQPSTTVTPDRLSSTVFLGTEATVLRELPGGTYLSITLGSRSYFFGTIGAANSSASTGSREQHFAWILDFGIGKRW